MGENKYGIDNNKYKKITIGELLEIKKISKMTIKNALPVVRILRDKHKLTGREALNLTVIAENFKL